MWRDAASRQPFRCIPDVRRAFPVRSPGGLQWKILVDPLKPGGYYAKVVRREEGTAGTIFVCRGDRSIVATIVPH